MAIRPQSSIGCVVTKRLFFSSKFCVGVGGKGRRSLVLGVEEEVKFRRKKGRAIKLSLLSSAMYFYYYR